MTERLDVALTWKLWTYAILPGWEITGDYATREEARDVRDYLVGRGTLRAGLGGGPQAPRGSEAEAKSSQHRQDAGGSRR